MVENEKREIETVCLFALCHSSVYFSKEKPFVYVYRPFYESVMLSQ